MTSEVGRLEVADYVVVVGYFVLILAVGAYFYRHMKGIKDFFAGGNRIPWWLSGVSFYMSAFSVFAFVSYSTLAYRYGWVAVTLFWSSVPGVGVSVLFFAGRWRRARIDSPVEYLEARYDRLVRQLFAWEGLPVRVVDDALKLAAISLFISSAGLGLSKETCLWGSGLIMLAYTFMGGLWAVVVTDFIQFVVMAVAVVVLVPLALMKAGGVAAAWSGAGQGFFRLTHPPEYDAVYVAGYILLVTLAYSSINWSLVQRYYCVPSERDAKKVGLLVMALYSIGPPLILLPAMLAPQFITVAEGEEVYARLCLLLLPAGMMGLIIAAMFAATMSMLSSDYNVCAAVLTNDVYRRLVRPRASQRELLIAGRLLTLLVGLLTICVASLMLTLTGEGLFRNMVRLFGIFTAPVAVPMLLGLLWPRGNKNGALAGLVAGVGVGLSLFFALDDQATLAGVLLKKETALLLATTLATGATMVVASLALPAGPAEQRRAEQFIQRLRVPIGELEEDRAVESETGTRDITPLGVVGVSVMLIGLLMLSVLPYAGDGVTFWMNLSIPIVLIAVGAFAAWSSHAASRAAVEEQPRG